MMDSKSYWERVYRSRHPEEVSWFQPHATVSRELIRDSLTDRDAWILDVGGGASTLADDLIAEGYRRITVLDLARSALVTARSRLAAPAREATWVQADVLVAPLARGSVAFWHDRAVFHFLTDPTDRARYVESVRHAVRPGGLAMVATFAADGPRACSGLAVARYGPDDLHASFGPGFRLVTSRREIHRTPDGSLQPFTYCLCRYVPPGSAKAVA